MTDNDFWTVVGIGAVVVGVVAGLALLYGVLVVWPLALVLVITGYLVWGATGALGGLVIAGVFGLLLIAFANS